ncbi:VTT domain-containing protein [Chloroflexota bacterium]
MSQQRQNGSPSAFGGMEPKASSGEFSEAVQQLNPGSNVAERRFHWKREYTYIGLIVMALLLMLLLVFFIQRPTDFEAYILSTGYGGVFLMGLIGSASPVWPLPGSWAAFIAAGLGLNPLILGLVAGFGEGLGELTGYTAGFGGQVVAKRFGMYNRVEGWMRKRGGLTIFLVSAIPNFFVKLASAAAGALKYPVWKFFLTCWAGKTIKSFGFAFAGWGLFTGIKELLERIF